MSYKTRDHDFAFNWLGWKGGGLALLSRFGSSLVDATDGRSLGFLVRMTRAAAAVVCLAVRHDGVERLIELLVLHGDDDCLCRSGYVAEGDVTKM